jgi:hypothetical protein
VDHLRTDIPELVVILIVVVLVLFGRRPRPKPPCNHPIPADDGFLLNRRRERPASISFWLDAFRTARHSVVSGLGRANSKENRNSDQPCSVAIIL